MIRVKKNNIKKVLVSPWFYLICVAIICRLIIGCKTGIWFSTVQDYDDALMVKYAEPDFFENPGLYSLVKMRAYSLFLKLVGKSGLSYALVLGILWCVDALLIYAIVKWISKRKGLSFFSFMYVLFYPTAFEEWLGTRLYRNSILVPCLILVFSLMIVQTIFIFSGHFHTLLLILDSILLGISFSFTFYIKEDGLWILCCLIALLAVDIFIMIRNWIKYKNITRRRVAITIVSMMIPLLLFVAVTENYKRINNRYFGVTDIQTRTDGELGEFVNNIYRIESPYRTANVWAPLDAIEKAYSVSETFQQYPELMEDIVNTPWYGKLSEDNQIQGDFLTWVLRTALEDSGLWKSEAQTSEIFAKINDEIEQAFSDGRLEESDRIQLLSSAGGRTLGEIKALLPQIIQEYEGATLLKGYTPGSRDGDMEHQDLSQFASEVCNIPYLADYSSSEINHERQNVLINVIFWIYRILNIILAVTVLSVLVIGIVKLIKRNHEGAHKELNNLILFLIIAMLLVQFVYSFSIAWFSSFLFQAGLDMEIINFYTPGMSALLVWINMLSILWVSNYQSDRKQLNTAEEKITIKAD